MRLPGLILKMGIWQSGLRPVPLILVRRVAGYPLTLILAVLAFSVLGSVTGRPFLPPQQRDL